MTRYEMTFTCRSCGEEVEPIKNGQSFLLPAGLHSCINREDSCIANITAEGIDLIADEDLDVEIDAHTIYPPDYEEHTLQWAENDDGEITAIQIIQERETSNEAIAGRSKLKMIANECREVCGSKNVIEKLREHLDDFLINNTATEDANDN